MKDKFIKSTIILMIGGLITKLLGMLIKIVMARKIGTEGLGLYMLVIPTFILLINLSQFGLPLALSKLISEDKRSNKRLFFSILPLLIIINLFLMITIIILAPYISNNLLHNNETTISIISMAFVIPFTSISSICRSYFFGKEKMIPHVVSNIVEDFIRLLMIIFLLPYITPLGIKYTVCFLIIFNIVSELASTVVLLLFLPKGITIKKSDLIPKKSYIKDSLKISIPTTTSRLVGSIGLFLEPIILTSTLLNMGYSINKITTEYGIISGYVIPLILLPSFFSSAISQALLPEVSKEYQNKNIPRIKSKTKKACFLSLLIGMIYTIIIVFNPEYFLKVIYHTTKGSLYIRVLAPICLLQYIESPLSSILDAIGKSKYNLVATIISTITRSILLLILPFFNLGIWSLIISIIMNVVITSFYLIKKVRQCLT